MIMDTDNEYNFQSHLTETQRKTFATRLLTLANILKAEQVIKYQHNFYFSKPKAGCALGHAIYYKNNFFPTLNLKFKLRNAYYYETVEVEVETDSLDNIDFWADAYFGASSYSNIFGTLTFDKSIDDITKTDVIERIEKFVEDSFGYTYA